MRVIIYKISFLVQLLCSYIIVSYIILVCCVDDISGRGGQSALRFARLRMEKRHNYVRKVAEVATTLFITNDKPNIAGIILAGSADFKTELSQSDMFDPVGLPSPGNQDCILYSAPLSVVIQEVLWNRTKFILRTIILLQFFFLFCCIIIHRRDYMRSYYSVMAECIETFSTQFILSGWFSFLSFHPIPPTCPSIQVHCLLTVELQRLLFL